MCTSPLWSLFVSKNALQRTSPWGLKRVQAAARRPRAAPYGAVKRRAEHGSARGGDRSVWECVLVGELRHGATELWLCSHLFMIEKPAFSHLSGGRESMYLHSAVRQWRRCSMAACQGGRHHPCRPP